MNVQIFGPNLRSNYSGDGWWTCSRCGDELVALEDIADSKPGKITPEMANRLGVLLVAQVRNVPETAVHMAAQEECGYGQLWITGKIAP